MSRHRLDTLFSVAHDGMPRAAVSDTRSGQTYSAEFWEMLLLTGDLHSKCSDQCAAVMRMRRYQCSRFPAHLDRCAATGAILSGSDSDTQLRERASRGLEDGVRPHDQGKTFLTGIDELEPSYIRSSRCIFSAAVLRLQRHQRR